MTGKRSEVELESTWSNRVVQGQVNHCFCLIYAACLYPMSNFVAGRSCCVGYVSMVFGNGLEGAVPVRQVIAVARRL
jgi:hypothetical protein